jgi:glycosyltransferase involved in cell wall biosynthesis
VNWKNVDHLVYVADHIKRKCEKRFQGIIKCPSSVIHNGVDYQNYSFAIRKPGPNVAFSGIFTWKKGIHLLVQTLRWMIKKDPKTMLHARIDIFEGDPTTKQALDYWDYCYEGLKDHIKFYPKREESLDGWYEDMNYVLHTSTIEAFSYAIAEAMCKGVKPLIYDWEGSREVWPASLIWRDFDELEAIMNSEYESRKYRDFVIAHYTRKKQTDEFKKLIESLK